MPLGIEPHRIVAQAVAINPLTNWSRRQRPLTSMTTTATCCVRRTPRAHGSITGTPRTNLSEWSSRDPGHWCTGRLMTNTTHWAAVSNGKMKRGGSTAFTYDGQDVILDQKSDGSTTTYVNGPGIDNKLKQTSTATGTHYYLQDHLGSTTALTDASGNVSTQMSYDGYGNSTSNSLTRYGYTGRELDADTGLMYYRARWYDPQLGRFISEDPIGFAGGDVNNFGYVRNNPLNWKDPMG